MMVGFVASATRGVSVAFVRLQCIVFVVLHAPASHAGAASALHSQQHLRCHLLPLDLWQQRSSAMTTVVLPE
jgi:hypothetical protein